MAYSSAGSSYLTYPLNVGSGSGQALGMFIAFSAANTTSRLTAAYVFASNVPGFFANNANSIEANGPSFGASPVPYGSTVLDAGTTLSQSIISNGHYAANVWSKFGAAFPESGNNIAIRGYLDGSGASSANTTAVGSGNAMTKTSLFTQDAPSGGVDTPSQSFIGSLGTFAWWIGTPTARLSDRELNGLSIGVSPRYIRRVSLSDYVPLIKNIFNAKQRVTITQTGSLTLVRHPRQYGW